MSKLKWMAMLKHEAFSEAARQREADMRRYLAKLKALDLAKVVEPETARFLTAMEKLS